MNQLAQNMHLTERHIKF